MAGTGKKIHGDRPRHCTTALLLIDFINDLAFPDGERLFPQALAAARRARALKKRAKAAGVNVIYANDNFGQWRSDFQHTVDHCLRDSSPGKPIVECLQPEPDDFFVLKPKHSAFFSTPLGLLLDHLGTETLVLTGITTDICVLFTAHDAYLHDFRLFAPADCAAAVQEQDHRQALDYLARVLKADTALSAGLAFDDSDAPQRGRPRS
jgi:nicotinamidase-related amidase